MKLMLIGGGETGRGEKEYSTKAIDEEVVKMTDKENPIFLFVGFASNSSESYFDTMKRIYTPLGCTCQNLKRKNLVKNYELAIEKIRTADIIYFCGGDTIKLLDEIKEFNLQEEIKQAINRNCVIAGMSAGAILLSNKGFSDSLILRGESDKYAFINGLKILDINICPHYDIKEKQEQMKEIIKETTDEVYCLEENTALKVENNIITIFKSDKNKKVYLASYKNNEYTKEELN